MSNKQLNDLLIVGGVFACAWIILFLFSQPSLILIALAGLFWYFNSRTSNQKLNIIQEFKNNPEKYLGSRDQVAAIKQSIHGLSSEQYRRSTALDLIEHLRFEIPKFDAPHLVKPGIESILESCFQILDPDMEPESYSRKAESFFEQYRQK